MMPAAAFAHGVGGGGHGFGGRGFGPGFSGMRGFSTGRFSGRGDHDRFEHRGVRDHRVFFRQFAWPVYWYPNYPYAGHNRLKSFFASSSQDDLHLAGRTSESLEAIGEVEALGERSDGVFLAAIGAEETQIEASFCAAISTAKEQKSISLVTRAEATFAEYRRFLRVAQST
jgi:hypothetical protein